MKTLKQHAREKLGEANFHLRNLAREEKKVVRNEPEAFKSSLNGFLNAGYAVTCALANQAKKSKIKNWRDKLLSADESKFLDRILRKRGAEIHDMGMKIIMKEKAIPAERVPGFQVSGPP